MKQLKVSVPEGYEIDKDKSTFENIVFKEVSKKPTAKQWLENFLKQDFIVTLTPGYITFYLNDEWIFHQDLKSEHLWVRWTLVWKILKDQYLLQYNEIQSLIKDVVGEALNCKGFTPTKAFFRYLPLVGEALNCKGFTPSAIRTGRYVGVGRSFKF